MDLKEFKADLKPNFSKHQFSSNRKIINNLLFGNITSNLKNKGMEFEDFRRYTLSDDAVRIDWKASLKANQLLIRESIVEKSINVLFLLDVSDTMIFSSGDKLKCEYAAELIAGLSFSIQLGGNASGICLFNDHLTKILMPESGAIQYFNIISELRNTNNYGGKCDLGIALQTSLSLLKSTSLIIIISDFINPGDNWNRYLGIAAIKHNILGICVRDKLDRRLPENIGYFVLEDPGSQKKIVIDTKESFKKYNQKIKEDEFFIQTTFKRASSSCVILETTENYETQLINFLENKTRSIKW